MSKMFKLVSVHTKAIPSIQRHPPYTSGIHFSCTFSLLMPLCSKVTNAVNRNVSSIMSVYIDKDIIRFKRMEGNYLAVDSGENVSIILLSCASSCADDNSVSCLQVIKENFARLFPASTWTNRRDEQNDEDQSFEN